MRASAGSTRHQHGVAYAQVGVRAQISNFKELLAIMNFNNIDELDFHFDYPVGSSLPVHQGEDALTLP